MAILTELSLALRQGDTAQTRHLVERALTGGLAAQTILDEGLMPGMDLVGKRFREGDMFVPEVLLSARAMQEGMKLLRPGLVAGGARAVHKAVLGTVKGDLHDIGKNLVAILLAGAGFEVHDLGVDVSPEKFVLVVRAEQPNILGLSALLTTTMPAMSTIIKALEQAGIRDRVRVIIGGAPVTQQFAEQIGADGYGSNAGAAADLARRLLRE